MEIRGSRDAAQLYQLELAVSAAVSTTHLTDAIDFRQYTVDTLRRPAGSLRFHSD